MGRRYVAAYEIQVQVQFESPEGLEAQVRAEDLATIIEDKLPAGVIYRSQRGRGHAADSRDPHVAGSPRMMGKQVRLLDLYPILTKSHRS